MPSQIQTWSHSKHFALCFRCILLLLALILVQACGIVTTENPRGSVITGVTVTTNGGKSAKVYLYDSLNYQKPKDSVFSDSEGFFEFKDLKAGRYAIRSVLSGDSLSSSRSVHLGKGETKNITMLLVINITIVIQLPDSLQTQKVIYRGQEISLDSLLELKIDPNGFEVVQLLQNGAQGEITKNYGIQEFSGQYVLVPIEEYLRLTDAKAQSSQQISSSLQSLSSSNILLSSSSFDLSSSSSAILSSSSGIALADSCWIQQPDANQGLDNFVQSLTGYENNNNATNAQFVASTWNHSGLGFSVLRSFIKFDLSPIPVGANLTKAHLSLFAWDTTTGMGYHQVTSSGTNDVYLERVTADWQENTTTWNNQPTTTQSNRLLIQGSTIPEQDYLAIDVLKLTQDIIASGQNYGWMMRQVDEVNAGRKLNFRSSDHPIASSRPKLEICWSR
jgi:hypothetical protein